VKLTVYAAVAPLTAGMAKIETAETVEAFMAKALLCTGSWSADVVAVN